MIFDKIGKLLNKGDKRGVLIKKNILASLFIKGASIFVSLLYVPITLNYLNPTRYGIWMTLTSIVAWIGIFDIGLGNGLRNKLTESLAIGDKVNAQKYVSTAYAMLSLIVIIVLLIFYAFNNWIDWTLILNTSKDYEDELKSLTLLVVTLFGAKFVLNIITTIFTSDQLPAIGGLIELICNALGLLLIWAITQTKYNSLLSFGWATMLTPVIVYLIVSLLFFNGKYNYLKPSFKSIRVTNAKGLTGLGIQFFFIQIAVLIIFQTSNILIAQFFEPAEVTPYNIVFKYFSVLIMLWGILMTPLWSAFTKALAENDINWMRKTILKLNKLMTITVFVIVVLSLIANYVILKWTAGQVNVQPLMIWIFALYTLISIWNNIYSFFLNGINKTRIQIYTSIVAAIIHIPIAYTLVKYLGMGSEGVVLSMAISLSLFSIAGPLQTYKILHEWKMKN